jgi:hypothetical protein
MKYSYNYLYYPTPNSRTLCPLDLTGRYVQDRELIRFRVILHDSNLHADIYEIDIAVIPFCSTDDSDHPVVTFRPAAMESSDFSTYTRSILSAHPYNVVIRETALLNLSQLGAGTMLGNPSSTNPATSIVTNPPPPMAGDFNAAALSLDHELRIGQNSDETTNNSANSGEEEGMIFSDACIEDLRAKTVLFLDAISQNITILLYASRASDVLGELPTPQLTETQQFVDDIIGDIKTGRVLGSTITLNASPIFMEKVFDVQTLLWQQQQLRVAIASSTDSNERLVLQQQLNSKIALSGTVDPVTGALTGGTVTTKEWLLVQFLDATSVEEASSKDGRPGSWLFKTYVPIKYPGWFSFAAEMRYSAVTDTFEFKKFKIPHKESDVAVQRKLFTISQQIDAHLCDVTGTDIPCEQTPTCA